MAHSYKTAEEVHKTAQDYLDKGPIYGFTDLCNAIKDDVRLVGGITPDMVGQAAQKCLDEEEIETLSDLFEIVQDNQTLMQAALPGHDIFYIPAGEKTHKYDMTLAFNRENGQFKFFAACLPKDSLLQLKEHWEEHYSDQRREQALPTVVRVFRQIAAGESPTHATTVIVDDVDRVARAAERELKAAGYSVPRAA